MIDKPNIHAIGEIFEFVRPQLNASTGRGIAGCQLPTPQPAEATSVTK
jgi:hypothetical protein